MIKYIVEALIDGETMTVIETDEPSIASAAWAFAKDTYPAATLTKEEVTCH